MNTDSMRRSRRREDGAARCWAVARKLALGLSLALACQSALAQAMYRIKPLSPGPGGCGAAFAYGFNAAGEVVGEACSHAYLWKNNGTLAIDLGPTEAGSTSGPRDVSESGVVTGYAQDSTGEFAFLSSGDGTPMKRIYDSLGGSKISGSAVNDLGQLTGEADTTGTGDGVYHAFVWKNNGTPLLDLGTLGGSASNGIDINASGQIVGNADLPGNAARHGFIWKNDGSPMVDLGTLGGTSSDALFINASGQVAGDSSTSRGRYHAYFWRNDGTPMQDLGTLGGQYVSPVGLNDSGQIGGNSYTHATGAINNHAFFWPNDGTPIRDLGTLGGTFSEAYDMNSSGQVTGRSTLLGNSVYHAFLWRNDGTKIQDLNKLIDPTDPLKPYITLTQGEFINKSGDIAAFGKDSRQGLAGVVYLLQGTVLTLTPRSLAFGNRPINTTSAAKSVTVTNTSPKPAPITSIKLGGTNANQFSSTNNCGSSLAGKTICTINVKFKPTSKGTKSATLSVNGGGGGLRVVSLTGTGT